MAPAKTVLETGTTALTGPIMAIQIVADAVFAVLSGLTGDSPSGVTFPAGMILYGNFTAVTLTSGSIIAYYAL